MKWWDEQNRCTYKWKCKNYRFVVLPVCCSRSQQRSSPGLRLGLTALLVLIERVRWISHSLITATSALDNRWQSTFHRPVCGRRSCRPARHLSSSTHSDTSERCLATALRVIVANRAVPKKREVHTQVLIRTWHNIAKNAIKKTSGKKRKRKGKQKNACRDSTSRPPLKKLHPSYLWTGSLIFFVVLRKKT